MVLARYVPDGAPDPTFGSAGVVRGNFSFGPMPTSQGLGGVFTGDGTLIVVGSSGPNSVVASWLAAGFVADLPPTATFTVAPAAPAVGEAVILDASASSDADGVVAGVAWDLDGDGAYDDASGAVVTTSFSTGRVHAVGVRVTDDNGVASTATGAIPVACGQARSLLSVDCRLEGLLAQVDTGVAAGALHDRLRTLLTTARNLAQQAAGPGPERQRRKRLARARRALARFVGKVRGARRHIASPLRDQLAAEARDVRTALTPGIVGGAA
jgi:hypothetical protein